MYFILSVKFGIQYKQSFYHSKNAVETMLFQDSYRRLVDSNFGYNNSHNWTYLLTVLDAKLNLWNYLFYATVLFYAIKLFSVKQNSKVNHDKLLVFSFLFTFSLGVILTFSANKNVWYLTPALPFISCIICFGISSLLQFNPKIKYVVAVLLLFTLTRNFIFLFTPNQSMQLFFSENKKAIENAKEIYIKEIPTQAIHLYLKFTDKPVVYSYDNDVIPKQSLIISKNNSLQEEKIGCYKDDCLFVKL